MKHMTIGVMVLASLVVGSVSARAASDNPFEFETTKHPLKYDYCKKDGDPKHGLFRHHGCICSSAPRPHPDFHKYIIQFVEEVGLRRIIALSYQQRAENNLVEEIRNQIAEKYGLPTYRPVSVRYQLYEWLPQDGFPGVGDVTGIPLSVLGGKS